MTSEKADLLATVSLFSHLKEEELQRLAGQSRYCVFKFGEVIIQEGERDDRLYVLISGKATVFKSYRTQKEKRLRRACPHRRSGQVGYGGGHERHQNPVPGQIEPRSGN